MVAQLLGHLPGGSVRNAFKEGLVIFGWVLLWRPVDVLIYEWLPARKDRRLVEHLLDAPLEVRAERSTAPVRSVQAQGA